MRSRILLDFGAFETRPVAATQALVMRGAKAYDRAQHLPRVLPVEPGQLADLTPQGRRIVVRRLAKALRAERNRGRAGHWAYDLNRHFALAQAYAAERRLPAPAANSNQS